MREHFVACFSSSSEGSSEQRGYEQAYGEDAPSAGGVSIGALAVSMDIDAPAPHWCAPTGVFGLQKCQDDCIRLHMDQHLQAWLDGHFCAVHAVADESV